MTDTRITKEEPIATELVEQFARYLKSAFMYPRNNAGLQRVRRLFLAGLAEFGGEDGSNIELVIVGERFEFAGLALDATSPLGLWLRGAFVKTAIGGISFDPCLEAESLQDFAEELCRNFSRPETSFRQLWRQDFPGVCPIELRVTGTFICADSASAAELGSAAQRLGTSDLAFGKLLGDEILLAKLTKLQDFLGSYVDGDSPTNRIDILDPISRSLPAEASLDPEIACQLVDEILDACGARVASLIEADQSTAQDLLESAVADVGRRFFKALLGDTEAVNPESLPEGRPGDAGIEDDLDAMLAEFEALPVARRVSLGISPTVCDREVLGAGIFQLIHAEDATQAEKITGWLLEFVRGKIGIGEVVCGPYLDLCLSEEGRLRKNRPYWRVVDFVYRSELACLLGGRDFLAPEVVAFTFPQHFGPFLDALDTTGAEDIEKLRRVCQLVGADRIAAAEGGLVKDAVLVRAGRVRTILLAADQSLHPMLKIILDAGAASAQQMIAEYLLDLDLPVDRSGALQFVKPLTALRSEYLQALCTSDPDGEQLEWLRRESNRLLANYLRRTTDDDGVIDDRIRAIECLRLRPSAIGLWTLRGITKEGGRLLLGKARRRLRRAARTAHDEMVKRVSQTL